MKDFYVTYYDSKQNISPAILPYTRTLEILVNSSVFRDIENTIKYLDQTASLLNTILFKRHQLTMQLFNSM